MIELTAKGTHHYGSNYDAICQDNLKELDLSLGLWTKNDCSYVPAPDQFVLCAILVSILESVDNSSPKARRPATCSRDLEILLNTQHYCTEIDRTGSRGQAAGRRDLKCQQPLKIFRYNSVQMAAKSMVFSPRPLFFYHLGYNALRLIKAFIFVQRKDPLKSRRLRSVDVPATGQKLTTFSVCPSVENTGRQDPAQILFSLARAIAIQHLELADNQLNIFAQNHTLKQLDHLLRNIEKRREFLTGMQEDLQQIKTRIKALKTQHALLQETAQHEATERCDEITSCKEQLLVEHNKTMHIIQQQKKDETKQYEEEFTTLNQLNHKKEQLLSHMSTTKASADQAEIDLAAEKTLLDQTFFLNLNADRLSQCLIFTTSPRLRFGMHWRLAFIELDRGNITAARFHLHTVLKSHVPPYMTTAQQQLKKINLEYPPEGQHKPTQKIKKASKKTELPFNIDEQIEKCNAIKSQLHSTPWQTHLAMLELITCYAKQNRPGDLSRELDCLQASPADVELKAWGLFLCGEYWHHSNVDHTAVTFYQQALHHAPHFTEARYCLQNLIPHQKRLTGSKNSSVFFSGANEDCHAEPAKIMIPGYPS